MPGSTLMTMFFRKTSPLPSPTPFPAARELSLVHHLADVGLAHVLFFQRRRHERGVCVWPDDDKERPLKGPIACPRQVVNTILGTNQKSIKTVLSDGL